MPTVAAYNNTGLNVVAVFRNDSMQYANNSSGGSLESYNASNIDKYAVSCSPVGATGEYYCSIPSWANFVPGVYTVQFVLWDGDTLVESDMLTRFAVGTFYYDGTNIFFDWATKLAVSAAPVSGSQEEYIISGGTGEGTGSGAWTVVITVDDGTDPLEGAKVRLTKVAGSETYLGTTDVNGEVTFNVDTGTWTVAVTLANYTYSSAGTGDNLTVDGDETKTCSMTITVIPVSEPGFVTGYLYCYDEDGVIESGVVVQLQAYSYAGSGLVIDGKTRSETSDVNGRVTFTNLLPGAKYRVRRGTDSSWTIITISAAATDPYAMTAFVGEEGA